MLSFYLQSILTHMTYVKTKLGQTQSAQCKLITDIISLEGKEEEGQKRICRQLNMNTVVCRNLFYGHYSVFVAGLGIQQAS